MKRCGKIREKLKKRTRRLKRLSLFEKALLLAPIMVWFGNTPRVQLGADNTMYYRLSLALIYVAVLALVALPVVWRNRRTLIKSKYAWLVLALVTWTGLTALWSENPRRGVLTFGVTGALGVIFWAVWSDRGSVAKLIPALVKILIVQTVIMCVLALAQVILGAFTASGQEIVLCRGCVAGQFGFARPNVFAIEPQFFGSLLLAPTLIMAHAAISSRRKKDGILLWLFMTVLTLTMSRGAIYSGVVGLIVLLSFTKVNWQAKVRVVAIGLISVATGLLTQGVVAQINPYLDITFSEAINSSVNHLTLGKISLIKSHDDSAKDTANGGKAEPAFSGYVEESTTIRTNLSAVAFRAWRKESLLRKMVGTGLGSAGVVMARETGNSYQREIVQNEYVEVLLERGAIGLALLLMVIMATFYELGARKWRWSILVSYLLQYLFFSGLPNALHVYLSLDGALAGKDLPDSLK